MQKTERVTDEMVEAGLKHYAEGGCMGLDDRERREVVTAIIEAAVAALSSADPVAPPSPNGHMQHAPVSGDDDAKDCGNGSCPMGAEAHPDDARQNDSGIRATSVSDGIRRQEPLTSSAEEKAVEVKKLEWVKHPTAELWRACTMLGVYQVHAFKIPGWTFDGHDGGGTSASADDIEAAKAAAQQDYETRIRSALVDVPAVEGESDGWLCSAPAGVWSSGRIDTDNANVQAWRDKGYTCTPYWLSPSAAHPPRSSLIQSEEGWRPIETAPKDGTAIDLWGINHLHFAKTGRRATNVTWGRVRDWMGNERDDWQHGHGEDFEPTHWMPLPTPPSPYGGDNGDGPATGTKGCAE